VTDVVDGAFRRHYATVYRYIRRRTGDDDRAEDLAQEVFTAAAAALPTEGDGQPPILAWLYTVAQRRFADEARRSARTMQLEVSPRRQAEYSEPVGSAIATALSRLQPEQRSVVVLKLLRGLSFAEIGEELGITPAAAKMRFSRALAALRADLRKEGVEP
jgi:RNA polymerase sigma factor (sigma-70 family)